LVFLTMKPPVSTASAFIPWRSASTLRDCRSVRIPGALSTPGPRNDAWPPGGSETSPRVSSE
jgi:hypothetical protein